MDNTASCITQLLLVYDVHLHSYVCGTFYKFSCKLLKKIVSIFYCGWQNIFKENCILFCFFIELIQTPLAMMSHSLLYSTECCCKYLHSSALLAKWKTLMFPCNKMEQW